MIKCYTTNQPPFYGHCIGNPALASTSSQKLEDFVGAKFYCQHALADSNQYIRMIRIREKTLKVLSTLSLYLYVKMLNNKKKNNITAYYFIFGRGERISSMTGNFWYGLCIFGVGILWD